MTFASRHAGRVGLALAALALGVGCGSDHDSTNPSADQADSNTNSSGEDTVRPDGADGADAPTAGACWTASPPDGEGISFVNATEDAGLVEPLTGMYGHATAAADVNGDGWTDLFVAGFADRPDEDYQVRGASGPSPDQLLLGGPDGFAVDPSLPGELARTSGATFADLDGDGDLDLVVVRNPRGDDDIGRRATAIYQHDDSAWTLESSLGDDLGGRSVAAIDVDRDGRLDLAIAGDRFGAGPSRLYRNDGDFTFTDTTIDWGMPADLETLAIATVDLDGDGWTDIVSSGDTRVLVGGPDGFEVVEQPVLAWQLFGDEDDPAGISVGDLDGDGRPDLAIGQHFNSTIDDGREVPIRVLLNRSDPGSIEFEDVTDASGSPPLSTKSPHVSISDLDNDGHPDIVTSAAAADGTPIILHNTGEDPLRFETIGEPGDETYWVTGATEDFDHDGRLDVFMMAWEPGSESPLFRSTGAAGSWLEVDVSELGGNAPDAVVQVDTGDATLTGWAQSTTGYAAGAPLVVRFGIGDDAPESVDILVDGGDSSEVQTNARTALGPC